MAAAPCIHEEFQGAIRRARQVSCGCTSILFDEMAMAQLASQNERRNRQILKSHHYDVRTSQLWLAEVLKAVPINSVERVSYRLRQSIDLQVRRREKEREGCEAGEYDEGLILGILRDSKGR